MKTVFIFSRQKIPATHVQLKREKTRSQWHMCNSDEIKPDHSDTWETRGLNWLTNKDDIIDFITMQDKFSKLF